jgi:Starch-binding associating with outer membrane
MLVYNIKQAKNYFMKRLKISSLFVLGAAILFGASCKKEYFTKANVNPNSPTSVTPAVVLPTVEGTLAYSQGGDMSRFTSMFVQQTAGISRQSAANYTYVFTGQDVDGLWGNLYTSVMLNDTKLMEMSDAAGYHVYSGVSRVLMAYTLQLTVDMWGSIPFSQAFQGFNNLQPAYDVDATLYTTIQNMCDSAIYYLNLPTPGALVPGAEDAIYGGDATKWTKFAHAIKARTYIHQAKGSNKVVMATNALNELALSFADATDNAIFANFGAASNANNPWYQFNNQREDISFRYTTLAGGMVGLNDPRYPFMIDTTDPNYYNDNLASYYGGNPAATVEFITYDELQFMTAEATLYKGGALADVQTAYQNGITASMTKLGVASTDMATYLAANGTLTASTALSSICWEEYVALYLNPEAWTMWRRTALPALTSTNPPANIPRRLLYPQTEYSYNKANVPAGSTMYVPVIFWDK